MSETADLEAQIEALYRELEAGHARLVDLLKRRGPEAVDDYVLQGPDGEVRLSDLFGDKDDLLVVHNMGRGCPYCTLWADGFQGLLPHLQDRAAFAVVSPDAPHVQQEFAASRGWTFRLLSSAGSTFTADMGYVGEYEGKRTPLPGFSTFRRRRDGGIERVAHAPFGPGDPYCALWHLFALLADGAAGWQPRIAY